MTHMNHHYLDRNSINTNCTCFNMRKVARALTQFFDRHLESYNIRSTQFTLLVELDNKASKTLTEIANTLVMDRTTLTRNLKPLEKNGLIISTQTKDKRTKAYALTQKGHELVNNVVPLWQTAQEKIIVALSENKVRSILSDVDYILAKIPKH